MMVNVRKNETVHLKCKFCSTVCRGQQEFFNHVIVSHAKTLKQKLNKAAAAAASSGAGLTGAAQSPSANSEHHIVTSSGRHSL
jgi:uncharacterized C2H2 Zn-finger protein